MVDLKTLEEIKNEAVKNNIPIIEDDSLQFITDYIVKNNIKKILEIGTAVGYSSIVMALSSPSVSITSIERDKDRYLKAVENIKRMNLENRITLLYGDALEIELNGKFDLIFIDAAKSQYIKFFEKYKKNLNDNGVIITDNLSFHGMVDNLSLTHNRNTKQLVGKIVKYIDFLKNNEEFDTEFISIGDGIGISRRKS